MPTGIEEAAATALVKRGVATVGNSAIRWLSLGPRKRLFRLLFVEFGDSVAMPKDEFYAFATDEELSSLTDDLLAGRRRADDATAGLIAERIETRLHRVPEADRHAMASEIGTFAVFSYTAALKTPEELGHNIAAKVDMYGTQTTAALTDIQAELKRLVGAGDKETDLVAALMSSPLEHAGQTETVAAAQKLAGDGKHSEGSNSIPRGCRRLGRCRTRERERDVPPPGGRAISSERRHRRSCRDRSHGSIRSSEPRIRRRMVDRGSHRARRWTCLAWRCFLGLRRLATPAVGRPTATRGVVAG